MLIIMALKVFIWSAASFAAEQELTVSIEDIDPCKGKLIVSLFKSQEGFLQSALQNIVVSINGKSVVVAQFKNVPYGSYAISVIHDVNGNGQLDTNFLGIPKEGYAFSSDAQAIFGPPTFDEAKFYFDPENSIVKIHF